MTIPIPEGYELPEDIADGDTFEELVTFRLAEGALVPEAVAGIALAAEEAATDEAVADEEMSEADLMSLDAMAGRMSGM